MLCCNVSLIYINTYSTLILFYWKVRLILETARICLLLWTTPVDLWTWCQWNFINSWLFSISSLGISIKLTTTTFGLCLVDLPFKVYTPGPKIFYAILIPSKWLGNYEWCSALSSSSNFIELVLLPRDTSFLPLIISCTGVP